MQVSPDSPFRTTHLCVSSPRWCYTPFSFSFLFLVICYFGLLLSTYSMGVWFFSLDEFLCCVELLSARGIAFGLISYLWCVRIRRLSSAYGMVVLGHSF